MTSLSRKIVPDEKLELEFRDQGFEVIAGLDEVGRGAWAGPLVVGAVILPPSHRILELRDSKLMTRDGRERIARRIYKLAETVGIGVVLIEELNSIGLAKSLRVAATRAIGSLSITPDIVLIDGKYPFRELDIDQRAIVRGDQTVRSVAAASVVAKVERDRLMRTLHRNEKSVRPFRFDLNKGYPSPHHRRQLTKFGPSIHHRSCFAPIRSLLQNEN